MTANLIAKVVDSLYNKINIDEMSNEFKGIKKYEDCGRKTDEWVNKRIENKDYYRWLLACSKLEEYLLINYANFEETELVYRWGKRICEARNNNKTIYRSKYRSEPFEVWVNRRI
jgi:hypothetical protein